ncbi:DUF11 domain-containing protein [Rubellimicrobium rubrum]|uniref:DUF11 domain-containing protein n=1 Tax=Rubellimicrobium rubrum TaxID=2585369 RepID=UPI00159B9FA1|nr:DUF11 domain-containing protein [Rubellimicrobium rubrum]
MTVTLQNNSNNPTGSTFVPISAEAPTASLEVGRLYYSSTTNFTTHGVYVGDAQNQFARLAPLGVRGTPASGNFTSLPGITAGQGISVDANYAWFVEARTRGLAAADVRDTGSYLVADLVIRLQVPMTNVVLHFAGLGGIAGKRFSSEFVFDAAQSAGAQSLSRLSGTSNFAVSGTVISNSATSLGADCGNGGACGSVAIVAASGQAITKIVLHHYLRSRDSEAWGNTGVDAFTLSLSGEVADMVPTLTLPDLLWGETYRGLTATCTNAGPNTVRNPTCAVTMSGAGTMTTPVCGAAPGSALAVDAALTCTFDYTAPAYNPNGPASAPVTFTTTTGGLNDRNGGTTTLGNNQRAPASTVTGSPYAPSQPGQTCSATANVLSFAFPGAGGTETGSGYDLISHSPFSFDVNGKPVLMTASGTPTTQTITMSPGALFKPNEEVTLGLPALGASSRGEIVVVTSRIVGRAGSSMTVTVSDAGDEDHDVFTIENAAGGMIARAPTSGSNNADGDLVLSFTMPSEGYVFLRQYVTDYAALYGARRDGGCLRTDLRTVKGRTSAASIEVGQTATFTITVTNTGPSAASNVQLTDLMPPTLTGVTVTAPAETTYNTATGLWTVPRLANGAAATLTLTGTATMAASNTTVTNTTTAAIGDQPDPSTAGDVLSASVLVLQAPMVRATKTVTLLSNQSANCATRPSTPDTGVQAFIPGSCVEYLIGLTNPTGSVARDILMTDVLAAGLTFMGAAATGFDTSDPSYALLVPSSGTACTATTCTIRLDKARLAANSTGQVRIRAVLR